MQNRLLIKFLVNDVTNAARTRELENDGVNERNMIGQKEEAARRQLFVAKASDPINCLRNDWSQEIERPLTE